MVTTNDLFHRLASCTRQGLKYTTHDGNILRSLTYTSRYNDQCLIGHTALWTLITSLDITLKNILYKTGSNTSIIMATIDSTVQITPGTIILYNSPRLHSRISCTRNYLKYPSLWRNRYYKQLGIL